MTNQLIIHRLLIDNSLISRMLLMSSISYVLVVIAVAILQLQVKAKLELTSF